MVDLFPLNVHIHLNLHLQESSSRQVSIDISSCTGQRPKKVFSVRSKLFYKYQFSCTVSIRIRTKIVFLVTNKVYPSTLTLLHS